MAEKLYLNSMAVKLPENNDSYFIGKHSTQYGAVWSAIFGTEKIFKEHLEMIIQNSTAMFLHVKTKNKQYSCLKYPENSKFSVLSLTEKTETRNKYISSYPLLIGLNNDVKLKESYPWENEGEGEMAAEISSGKIINFHNPFFAIDNNNFGFNKTQTISLAGLVIKIDKQNNQEISALCNACKHYLEELDYEVQVDTKPFRMFVPTDYCSEIEVVTQIEEIKYIEVLNEKIAVMKVNLEHNNGNEHLYCNIYASQHVLGKYKPKVRDGISAIVWMTGFFN